MADVQYSMGQIGKLGFPKPEAGGDAELLQVLIDLAWLHIKKSKDYGSAQDVFQNIRASETWGIPAWKAALVRAGDKMQRLKVFAATGKLENESVEDSMIDLASYAIIALRMFREANQDKSAIFPGLDEVQRRLHQEALKNPIGTIVRDDIHGR